jgi:hypothetical protein
MTFIFGFASGMAFALIFVVVAIWTKRSPENNSDRFYEIQSAQLKVFNERMAEERRMADALESLIYKVFNKQP